MSDGSDVSKVGWGPVGHAVVTKLLAKSAAMKITVITEATGARRAPKIGFFGVRIDPRGPFLGSVLVKNVQWLPRGKAFCGSNPGTFYIFL